MRNVYAADYTSSSLLCPADCVHVHTYSMCVCVFMCMIWSLQFYILVLSFLFVWCVCAPESVRVCGKCSCVFVCVCDEMRLDFLQGCGSSEATWSSRNDGNVGTVIRSAVSVTTTSLPRRGKKKRERGEEKRVEWRQRHVEHSQSLFWTSFSDLYCCKGFQTLCVSTSIWALSELKLF